MLNLKKENEMEKIQKGPNCIGIEYRSNIWKLYLYHMLFNFILISGLLIPFYVQWGKITFLEIMLLQSWFTLATFAFEIPCGAISDRMSRKFSLVLGASLIGIASVVYSSVPNIIVFCIGEALWALGGAFMSGTLEALTYDTLRKLNAEEKMGKIMARNQSFALIGITISAPLGSLLSLYIPLNLIMALIFFPLITAAIVALSFKEPNHNLIRQSKKYIEIVKSGFRELKKNKTLRILAFDQIAIQVIVFFILWMYQLYLEELGVPMIFFGFVASGLTLIQILFSNLIPKCEKSIKNKKLFLLFYSVSPGIAFILLALVFFPLVSIALLMIIVGFGLTRNIIFVRAINKQIETENRATVLSTISMFNSILRAIIYPLVGLLVMWNLNYTFIILGAIIIFLAITSRVKNEYLK